MVKKEERVEFEKTLPGSLVIGLVLIFIGILVFFYAVYSLMLWGLGEDAPFGLVGSILVIMLSVGIITIGSMFAFINAIRRMFGKDSKRLLY